MLTQTNLDGVLLNFENASIFTNTIYSNGNNSGHKYSYNGENIKLSLKDFRLKQH